MDFVNSPVDTVTSRSGRDCRYGAGQTGLSTRPCWPIIWLWLLSIAQYSYRYILQVNDPNTSHEYGATPRSLSAIKYVIGFVFVSYSIYCLARRPISIGPRYRALISVMFGVLMVLALVVLVRLAVLPGALDETIGCGLELVPWMAIVVFVPFVFGRSDSLRKTLLVFERITFWVAFPFWLMTIALAASGVRYPALSYAGLLVRFGGILDDPNGYACMCLLLTVLAISFRTAHWRVRVLVYVLMLIGTLSLAGYLTGIVIGLCSLPSFFRARISRSRWVGALCASLVIVAISLTAFWVFWEKNEDILDVTSALYSGKISSTSAHFSDLVPDEAALDVSSPVAVLCGTGGFSENFYWRVLANFGWCGLFAVVGALASWNFCALRRVHRGNRSLRAWSIGVLIGSNGIAYLLTFPLNLIYWSLLALMVRTRDAESSPELIP